MHHIRLNNWSSFVHDFELANESSQHTAMAAWDRLFIAVDAASARSATLTDDATDATGRGQLPSIAGWNPIMEPQCALAFRPPNDTRSPPMR